jgi:hypothetical protein
MAPVRPELVIQGLAVHSNHCEAVPQIHAAGMKWAFLLGTCEDLGDVRCQIRKPHAMRD